SGDWNSDGEFTTSDMVIAFQDGGYEQGPRSSVSSVPEPTTFLGFVIGGMLSLFARSRRKRTHGQSALEPNFRGVLSGAS
ncbi:MAG: PEP-CTERM sorting domain-containing protein, partial [Planctomycetales bacterium]|nr:PEP-CTERM sorting domain-containing protein [Planctomycetales bacterium]